MGRAELVARRRDAREPTVRDPISGPRSDPPSPPPITSLSHLPALPQMSYSPNETRFVEGNAAYAATFDKGHLPLPPSKQVRRRPGAAAL
jgi:hypothetical protein